MDRSRLKSLEGDVCKEFVLSAFCEGCRTKKRNLRKPHFLKHMNYIGSRDVDDVQRDIYWCDKSAKNVEQGLLKDMVKDNHRIDYKNLMSYNSFRYVH